MIMSGFYMVNSILLVLESSVLTRRDFWIANAVLYGSVYLFILFNGLKNIKFLYNETMLLKPTMPSEFRGPLIAKYRMFICLLVIVFVSMAMEVYCHSLVATDGRLWTVLMAYEISNILIMGILGIVFRPIEYSPFFFMVSTQHFDAGHMPMTVLDIADEHEDGHEDNVVELAPLIADNNRDLRDDEETDGRPSKLVIIKFPDSTIALGARN